ncbi:hypothetical protein Emtol_2787 [Emticicia oligotrophica DSM 17448]|uniref:Uncharacterized protein n=2 Tax=Emticicia TaxID=312278 RepID=A0ABM5N386_EMTOG|nr:hypothetical protein Emtol_2787 [Emticicia oligotrophica DSM 17448]
MVEVLVEAYLVLRLVTNNKNKPMWERYMYLYSKYPITATSDIITIFPVIVGIIFYKYLSKEIKTLFYFSVIHFIGDIYSTWLSVKWTNNLHIFNILEIVEASGMCFIFWMLFKQSTKKKLLLMLLITVLSIGIFKFRATEFAFIPYVFNRLCYMILVFLYFHTLLSETSVKNILTHPPFWLCATLTIYSTGSIIIFLFGEQILSSTAPHEKFTLFYDFISVINILCRTLICVVFFVSKYEKN